MNFISKTFLPHLSAKISLYSLLSVFVKFKLTRNSQILREGQSGIVLNVTLSPSCVIQRNKFPFSKNVIVEKSSTLLSDESYFITKDGKYVL